MVKLLSPPRLRQTPCIVYNTFEPLYATPGQEISTGLGDAAGVFDRVRMGVP